MADIQGLQIVISADTRDAILHLTDLTDATGELAAEGVGNLTSVNQALQAIRQAQQTTGDTSELNRLNRAIADLSSQASALKTSGLDQASKGFAGLNLNLTQSRVAFTDVGRLVTGQGFTLRSLAGNMALIGPAGTIAIAGLYGLYEVLTKQSDAEKKAAQDAEKLKATLIDMKTAAEVTQAAIGSEAGNIDRVQALAGIIQNTNLAYSQRSAALKELQATNKSYFGDLTLEADSLKTVADRVKNYSDALITEAIIKGQVENIGKLSSQYDEQAKALDRLKDARDRAAATEARGAKNLPANIKTEGEEAAVLQQQSLRDATAKANDAFKEQQTVVDRLGARIASYRGELDQAIEVQTKQKHLGGDGKDVDNLNKIKSIYSEIAQIYKTIATPSKEPLFEQRANANSEGPIVKSIQADIDEAEHQLQKAAGDPRLQKAYSDLLSALTAKLQHQENPNLISHVQYRIDIDEKEVEQAKELSGHFLTDYFKKQPPQKVSIKIDPQLIIQGEQLKGFNDELTKILQGSAIKGFSELSKGIGEALAGGLSGQNIFGGFLKLLGSSLEELGTYLLTMSPIIQGIKTALNLLDPAAMAIGGIASLALGGFIEAEASKSFKAFAVGGIVTGPTNALIGEAGTEVVFPLDRLNSFLKNGAGAGTQKVVVEGQISGRNIALAIKRDTKLQNMTS